ncbi:hypothetical protein D9M73_278960 [compost metagenome]
MQPFAYEFLQACPVYLLYFLHLQGHPPHGLYVVAPVNWCHVTLELTGIFLLQTLAIKACSAMVTDHHQLASYASVPLTVLPPFLYSQ